MKTKWKVNPPSKFKWHRWYAWFPVKIQTGTHSRWVWLEDVEQRYKASWADGRWQYQEIH